MSFWIPLLADNMDEAIEAGKFNEHGAEATMAHKFLTIALDEAMKT